MDAETIAKRLSAAQSNALIDCARFLDWAAGEGFCIVIGNKDNPDGSRTTEYLGADDCLYNLWVAFDLKPPAETYVDAVREILLRDQ